MKRLERIVLAKKCHKKHYILNKILSPNSTVSTLKILWNSITITYSKLFEQNT